MSDSQKTTRAAASASSNARTNTPSTARTSAPSSRAADFRSRRGSLGSILALSSPKMQNHAQHILENVRTTPKVRLKLLGGILVALLYIAMHVYIGIRSYQAFSPAFGKTAVTLLVGGFGMLFPITAVTLDQGRESRPLARLFAYAGYYWGAFFLYAVLITLGIDLCRIIDRWNANRLASAMYRLDFSSGRAIGTAAVLVILLLLGIGTWLARHPHVRRYDIPLTRPLLRPLRVALLSDIHFGSLVSTADLRILRDSVNSLEPDLVLLAGDLIDNSAEMIARTDFAAHLSGLKARHGVYGILGNHEYINATAEELVPLYAAAGIRVLRDEHVLIDGQLNLVGRDDRQTHFDRTGGRLDPASLVNRLEPDRPVLLMQHQPVDLGAIADAGVDLTVAGHTHKGQLFPLNLLNQLNRKTYEVSFGHRLIRQLHVVISSGYGTYGPPIRLGSQAEIVLLNLH